MITIAQFYLRHSSASEITTKYFELKLQAAKRAPKRPF